MCPLQLRDADWLRQGCRVATPAFLHPCGSSRGWPRNWQAQGKSAASSSHEGRVVEGWLHSASLWRPVSGRYGHTGLCLIVRLARRVITPHPWVFQVPVLSWRRLGEGGRDKAVGVPHMEQPPPPSAGCGAMAQSEENTRPKSADISYWLQTFLATTLVSSPALLHSCWPQHLEEHRNTHVTKCGQNSVNSSQLSLAPYPESSQNRPHLLHHSNQYQLRGHQLNINMLIRFSVLLKTGRSKFTNN